MTKMPSEAEGWLLAVAASSRTSCLALELRENRSLLDATSQW